MKRKPKGKYVNNEYASYLSFFLLVCIVGLCRGMGSEVAGLMP